ncbi:hypothetical protein ACFQJD_14805 [Haloplanus sp. GCM10025708]
MAERTPLGASERRRTHRDPEPSRCELDTTRRGVDEAVEVFSESRRRGA